MPQNDYFSQTEGLNTFDAQTDQAGIFDGVDQQRILSFQHGGCVSVIEQFSFDLVGGLLAVLTD
jgi:hypothetical protein